MTPQALLEKIQTLPPEKRAEAEDFVEFLATRRTDTARPVKTFPDELLQAINEEREELRNSRSVFGTLPIIRELRETGAR